jgi:hypothetical protein
MMENDDSEDEVWNYKPITISAVDDESPGITSSSRNMFTTITLSNIMLNNMYVYLYPLY